MMLALRTLARSAAALLFAFATAIAALVPNSAQAQDNYTADEIITAGHGFFGQTTGGLAQIVEQAFSRYGLPNGYVLGEQASGAFFGGLTYGEGTLYTKNAGDHKVFWQGPSLGVDWGAQGARTMVLVYNLPDVGTIYKRYAGVSGSAYIVAGLGFHVLKNQDVMLVPIQTGVGARVGINMGYLKLTENPTWNPL